jgi:dipeptidyl aminopeptidase/acylaminoacyl peptidase
MLVALAAGGCHRGHPFATKRGPFLEAVATPTSVTLTWAADAFTSVDFLNLQRKQAGKRKFRKIAELPAGTTMHVDNDVTAGTIYRYRLRVRHLSGKRDSSVILRVDVPKALVVKAPPSFGEMPWLLAKNGPRLSPDGDTLAHVEDDRVRLRDLTTGAERFATDGSIGPESGVCWLRGGGALVVAAGFPGGEALFVVRPEAERVVRLTDDAGAADPDVSPDGTRILFVRDGDIHRFEFGSRIVSRLLPGPAAHPRWSPGGDFVAWLEGTEAGVQVRIAPIGLDGTPGPPRVVGPDASGAGPVVWSPDQRLIAYSGASGRIELGGLYR